MEKIIVWVEAIAKPMVQEARFIHDFTGFCQNSYDSCVYLKKLENGSLLYLLLYVNDMLVTCDTFFKVENFKEFLLSDFDIKDLGEAKNIHRIEILRDQSKGVSTPLVSHFKLSQKLRPQTSWNKNKW